MELCVAKWLAYVYNYKVNFLSETCLLKYDEIQKLQGEYATEHSGNVALAEFALMEIGELTSKGPPYLRYPRFKMVD